MMGRLRKFARLGRSERRLLIEAAWNLARARAALAVVPFRRIAPGLGIRQGALAEEAHGAGIDAPPLAAGPPEAERLPDRVAWAIAHAAPAVPWQTQCLVRAMAAKAMLRRRGAPATLYLGTARDDEGIFKAHAWLRSGECTVTGGRIAERYSVIAQFAERPAEEALADSERASRNEC